jgi:succinate dehydrogenase / fumarate reductase flavoprotein subunit
MIDTCGVSRSGEKLRAALEQIPAIREQFWSDLKVGGTAESLNQSLEHAGRVADFLELGELMCRDALIRDESCGCHLREEHQGEDGEPIRDDDRFAHVAVYAYEGEEKEPTRHTEQLEFNELHPKKRSYR